MSVQEDLKDAEEEAEKAESANAMTLIANGGNIMNPAELVDNTLNVDVLCLPCEDEAYGDRLGFELFQSIIDWQTRECGMRRALQNHCAMTRYW